MRFGIGFIAAALIAGAPAALAQDVKISPDQANSKTQAAAGTVQAHINAYRSRNLTQFVNTFAPNAVVTMNGVTLANGRQEIRELYRLNFTDAAPQIRVDRSGMNGDNVYLSVAYAFADGTETCCSYSEYQIVGGQITRLDTQG
uniref:nuclear transport factor 2 family protein n=1 Tax=uncultured Erythrobacter sp. TaxID=263913 RepID=UPI00260A1C92|nr:nuclear transport factor 2 family protein [uncultured Erythrobacter sp.]